MEGVLYCYEQHHVFAPPAGHFKILTNFTFPNTLNSTTLGMAIDDRLPLASEGAAFADGDSASFEIVSN